MAAGGLECPLVPDGPDGGLLWSVHDHIRVLVRHLEGIMHVHARIVVYHLHACNTIDEILVLVSRMGFNALS